MALSLETSPASTRRCLATYDFDTRVHLVARGPGVRPGAVVDAPFVTNVDLCVEIDHWFGRSDQTLKISSSAKSKSIRLIFGRIDRSR